MASLQHVLQVMSSLFILFAHAQKPKDIRLPPKIVGSPLRKEDCHPGQLNCVHKYFDTEEDVTLKCDTSGTPDPKVDWYKTDDKGNKEKVDLNLPNVEKLADGSLRIESMTSLDEGTYHCEAQNIWGKAMSIGATLTRAALGSYPPTNPQTYTADEGDFLMIPCMEVKSVPDATYSWELVETEDDESPQSLDLSERLVINPKGNLYFSHIKQDDSSNGQLYTCNVFNPILDRTVPGSYSRITVNNVGRVPNKRPMLQYPDNNNKPVVAVLGEDFELKCIFSGKPAPIVRWKKVGGTLRGGRFDDTHADGTLLRITNIQWEDEADYVCTGSNDAGSKTYTFAVDVQSKPTFIPDDAEDKGRVLKNKNVTEGETTEFFCEADVKTEPSPKIELMINALPLDDNEFPGPRRRITKIDNRPGKILAIENVCKECPGGGTDIMGIQCKISNVHGEVFKSVYLNVLLRTTITVKPQDIHLSPEYLEEFGEVSFPCEAMTDDSTPITITWFYQRNEDDPKQTVYPEKDDRISRDEQNTLRINATDLDNNGEEYAGIYTCFATNGISNARAEAVLTVPGAPWPASVAVACSFDVWWIFAITLYLIFSTD